MMILISCCTGVKNYSILILSKNIEDFFMFMAINNFFSKKTRVVGLVEKIEKIGESEIEVEARDQDGVLWIFAIYDPKHKIKKNKKIYVKFFDHGYDDIQKEIVSWNVGVEYTVKTILGLSLTALSMYVSYVFLMWGLFATLYNYNIFKSGEGVYLLNVIVSMFTAFFCLNTLVYGFNYFKSKLVEFFNFLIVVKEMYKVKDENGEYVVRKQLDGKKSLVFGLLFIFIVGMFSVYKVEKTLSAKTEVEKAAEKSVLI